MKESGEGGKKAAAALAREARLFSRYLIGETPSRRLRADYVTAHAKLFGGPNPSKLASLATRNPWMLPYLDAGCGLLRPDDPLRQKLLLMTAILEATPDHTDHFLSETQGFWGVVWTVGWNGFMGVWKAGVGVALVGLKG